MATRNRLTDSGQNVRKGTAAQLGVKASKRRAAGELSTAEQRAEKKITKGPSAAAKANSSVRRANVKAGVAAWKHSAEYEPIKRDELRTTNDNYGNAPLGDDYFVGLEHLRKRQGSPYTENNKYLRTPSEIQKIANEKATKALEKNGGKSRVKTQKRLNAPIKNRATGRKVTK